MDFSAGFKKQAKTLGVPEAHIIFADLLSIGYSEYDAYNIAFPENTALSATRNKSIREEIMNTAGFKKLQEKRAETRKYILPTEPIQGLMDKEETAQMIMRAAMAQPAESKERIDGLMRYSDLMGYKKEDAQEDAVDNINFYFPLKCNQCPLLYAYNEYLQSIGETIIPSVEMAKVIDKAHPRIEKAREA